MKNRNLFYLAVLPVLVFRLASFSPATPDPVVPVPVTATTPGPGGDTNGYYNAMKANISKLDGSISPEGLATVLANFERIAKTEEDKWLPYYYVAFSSASLAYVEEDVDQIDVWCDRAEAALQTAEKLEHDASEIGVLRAFIAYARIRVDFMGRGFTYSREAMRILSAARQANPDNPRVYCLMGQHYLNVPAQLGGSKEKGCEYNSRAIELFEAERADSAGEEYRIEPHWGYGDAVEVSTRICGAAAAQTNGK
jgi:hypothetical protein